jgi:hypothetical protein
MTAPLRERYERARTLLENATTLTVQARYEIGGIVAQIRRDQSRYGQQAVALLAAALGRDETSLYRYAAVTRCWEPSVFASLSERRNVLRQPLSWSHWMQLAAVPDRRLRGLLVERALTEGLTVRAIRALVESRARTTHRSADALLRIHSQRAQRSVRLWAALELALRSRIADAGDSPWIENAIEAQRQVIAAATRLLAHLQAARGAGRVPLAESRGPWIAGGRGA